ncbi:MAG: hypothetical protein PHP85_11055 [Gallionella sp.]|nr:hypothetical protein [Gallionella sp.]
MNNTIKPKHAILAYCALAQRLNIPGMSGLQALTPFLAEACQNFAGELFDAQKFSTAVAQRYGFHLPRLAALGLAEQLHNDGLLTIVSGHNSGTVYKYSNEIRLSVLPVEDSITEDDIEKVLASFSDYCSFDDQLKTLGRSTLDGAFLDRLLNIDSMRILSRREASITLKKSVNTLTLGTPVHAADSHNNHDLHLDFMTSQFLLDLKDNDSDAFELVSDVAFANMAAEAIASFREPPEGQNSLNGLTVYLDSPILLDMLGVNSEYAEYGKELLQAIKTSGAHAAVLDHCVAEAEGAIAAQLVSLRSGVNSNSTRYGTSAKPDLLNALADNVGDRAFNRLGIHVERDPEVNLHRRSQATVGNIEAAMNERMQNWKNVDAKEHDRKSVWSMLAIRDSAAPCPRICDSKWVFLTRNTPLVTIANNAWASWLKGTTKHSKSLIEKWAPVSMSDKQFAGYVWFRTGGGPSTIPRTRLLASCSSAVRPRADIKAKAYNLALELYGKESADDIVVLFEDREGVRALMRATHGDPEDLTPERLPFILEKVKLEAGEFAAARAREEGARALIEVRAAYSAEVDRVLKDAASVEEHLENENQKTKLALLQEQQDRQNIEQQNTRLLAAIGEQAEAESNRKKAILRKGLVDGVSAYNITRWGIAICFGLIGGFASSIGTDIPWMGTTLTILLGIFGFWFVPDFLHGPLHQVGMNKLRKTILDKDPNLHIPPQMPDFRKETWTAIELTGTDLSKNQLLI